MQQLSYEETQLSADSLFQRITENRFKRFMTLSVRGVYLNHFYPKHRVQVTVNDIDFVIKLLAVPESFTFEESQLDRIFIKDCLESLKPVYQIILIHTCVYGFTEAELSIALGVSQQNVNKTKQRALKKLSNLILSGEV